MHKQIRKWISAALVASMLVPAVPTGFPGMAASIVNAAEETETQIASPLEKVYLNHYSKVERSMNFNNDWKFYLGEAPGAEAKVYNDAEWTTLNVPHDYSIDQEYPEVAEAESGFRLGGVGWYRKYFTVDPSLRGKRVTIEFDGVYMDSTVYLNGTELGGHPYGYTPFSFELPSELLDYEGENVIVVKVNHQTPSSRWYSGSGIYRDVKLSITENVHIDYYGVSVTTSGLEDDNEAANVNIKTALVNETAEDVSGVKVKYTIYKQGEEAVVASETVEITDVISAEGTAINEKSIEVANPQLWSSWDVGEPNLYVLNTQVLDSEGNKLDEYDTTFGFRTIKFERDKGFSINGNYIKLKGVCMHHDQGALGAEAWEDAIRRQVLILKGMGCNSIRVTHNPAAKVLIDICNEEGMLVVEEAFDGWDAPKNGNSNDYARFFKQTIAEDNNILGKDADMTWAEYDLKSMVLRSKNAPSVIMWSMGNEIVEGTSEGEAVADFPDIVEDLIQWVQEAETDSQRKITFGDNRLKSSGSTQQVNTQVANKIHAAGGIVGFNYADWNTIKSKTENYGDNAWLVYGSETSSPWNTRGVYEVLGAGSTDGNTQDSPIKDRAISAYDNPRAGWGATASGAWWEVVRFDANMGEYIWTGFDYLGEPTPWNGTGSEATGSKSKSSYFGAIDLAGIPKDTYYLYRSLWYEQEDDYTVHMLPTWDEEDVFKDNNGNVKVDVYSNAPKVKLVLETQNGEVKEFDAQTMTTHVATVGWDDTASEIHTYRTVDGVTQNDKALYYTWYIPYEAGTLKAVAYDGKEEDANLIDPSKITGRTEVSTTRGQNKLSLSVDEYTLEEAEEPTIIADSKSLAYVTIEVQDVNGKFVNGAEPEITVEVEGPGKLIGMDNGFQNDYNSYQSNKWEAHRGKVVAIIQSTKDAGDITVRATASEDGLQPGVVTIHSVAEDIDTEGDLTVTPVSVEMSKIYYVKKGTALSLPETLTVHYSDNSFDNMKVTWDLEDVTTEEEGNFGIKGVIEGGINVNVSVQVIGDVVALQNYSTYLRVGQEPVLPGTLPAITAEGEILNAYFNVDWDLTSIKNNEPGTYVVTGTADVFGKEMKPTASVRVTSGKVNQGSNAIINRFADSATLSNATNKEYVYDENTSGKYWQGQGSFKFGWATAVDVNKVVLYLGDTAPASDSTKLSWGLTFEASEYTPINATVTNERRNGMTVRTYEFSTVSAVGFGIEFEEDVKLYEAELYTAIPSFPVGSTAELEELSVKGKLVDDALMAIRQYATTDTEITEEDIVAIGKDNASVTVLPKYNNKIIILTKSEDGTAEDIYAVELGKEAIIFAGEEYDPTAMTATGYNQSSGDVASNVLDGNTGTIWHTNWNTTTLENTPENRYITIDIKQKNEQGELVELTEPVEINAVRYLPRQDGSINGRITEYRIAYSVDGTTWTDVPGGTGTWADDASWKIAEFTKVEAKSIRIYGVYTRGDSGDNKFVSAAEIRLHAPQKDLSSLVDVSLTTTEFDYTGTEICPTPVIQAKEGVTAEFVEGTDYTVEYVNNTNPGKAAVIVRGIGAYSGTFRVYYNIKERTLEIERVETVELTTTKGVVVNLPGTVTAIMTGGTQKELEVQWAEIPESFFAKGGEFAVKGKIPGLDIIPIAKIKVIDLNSNTVVAVPPIAVVTVQGLAPILPETVNVKCASGEYVDVPVIWEDVEDDWNQTAETIVKITGKIKGTQLPAVAQVRVAGASEETNLAVNTQKTGFPQAYAKYASGETKMWNAVNGEKNFDMNSDSHRWDNWERNVTDAETWYAVQFAGERIITRVELAFAEESGSAANMVKIAKDYDIQYYNGSDFVAGGEKHQVKNWSNSPLNVDTNWSTVEYTETKPLVPTLENFQTTNTVVNFTPIVTDFVRVLLTPQENQWTGLVEVGVYGYEVNKYNNYELTSIMINGQEMKDSLVEGGVYEYQLDGQNAIPEIQVTATQNALVTIEKPENAKSGEVIITVTAEDGNENSKKVYTINFVGNEETDIPVIVPETKDRIWVSGIKDLEYNGSKQTQEFSVYDGTKLLKEGTDYTVSYKNNMNAYTFGEEDTENFNKSKAPKVTIKMKGNYSDSKDIYFKILPMDINDNVFVDDLSGSEEQPKPVVLWNGKALKEGVKKDYTVTYNGKAENAGNYSLTIKGANNFGGEMTLEYTVKDVNYISMSQVKVATIKTQNWVDGGVELDFEKIKVTYKGKKLSLDEFEVKEYVDNDAVGIAYVVLKGLEETEQGDYAFTGTKTISFKIAGTSISKVKVNNTLSKYIYTGEEIKPLELPGKNDEDVTVTCQLKDEDGQKFTYELMEGEDSDYTVTYQKHINKGTGTMIFTGNPARGFTGTKKVNFKIVQQSLAEYEVEYAEDVPYMKGGVKPKVTLYNEVTGNELVEGTDYTISYKNNKNVAEGMAALQVKGKGNYNGKTEWFTFNIIKKDLSEDNGITVVAKDKVIKKGQETKWKQSFKVYDADGKALSANKDYMKEAEYTLLVKEGVTLETPLTLKDGDDVPWNSEIQITVKGMNNYDGGTGTSEVTGTYRILAPGYDISKASFKIAAKPYTGSEVTLNADDFTKATLKITTKAEDIKLDKHFIIVDYANNVNKGTAKVTLRGNEEFGFGGEKVVTFKISQRDLNTNWWEKLAVSAQEFFNF